LHKESYNLIKYFVEKYLDTNSSLQILDVGSYDVNGNYKSLFEKLDWKYTGLDIVSGPNVDIVSKSDYDFGLSHKYDVIVSGNCLEHVEAPWKWIPEVAKYLKPGGLLCIITPFNIGEHRYPVDCWRILPDGYKYLLEHAGLFKVIESKINYPPPEVKYKFFERRPDMEWLLRFIPQTIKEKVLVYHSGTTQDTIVVAYRNHE